MKVCIYIAVVALFLVACGSSSNKVSANHHPSGKKERERDETLYIPVDMPEICQNIDFYANKNMRKECGVKSMRYQAYYNMPMQRYLINPKQSSLVKTGDKIEIRFPNTFPVALDVTTRLQGVQFSEDKRLVKIENTMDYKEFYDEKKERFKLFKLKIPSDTQPVIENELCFKVPELKGSDRTRSPAMTVKMEFMTCDSLDVLVRKYAK
ncbi:MAG: hypothetical protein LBC64_03375 [Fibromonadaceae bacterium]|jgi:hypothetical protein|nr:hypothetical protein [Fibromonadaceae bacterium]